MTVTVGRAPTKSIKCNGCKVKPCVDDLTPGFFDGDYTESGPPGVGVKCPRCEALTEVDAPSSLVDAVHAKRSRRGN